MLDSAEKWKHDQHELKAPRPSAIRGEHFYFHWKKSIQPVSAYQVSHTTLLFPVGNWSELMNKHRTKLRTTLNMTKVTRAGCTSARPDKHYGETCHRDHSKWIKTEFQLQPWGCLWAYCRHDNAKVYGVVMVLSTLVHNFKWQWISDDRTLEQTSGAHVTVSLLPVWTDMLVYCIVQVQADGLEKQLLS